MAGQLPGYILKLPPALEHFPRKTILRQEKNLQANYFLQERGSCGNREWVQSSVSTSGTGLVTRTCDDSASEQEAGRTEVQC